MDTFASMKNELDGLFAIYDDFLGSLTHGHHTASVTERGSRYEREIDHAAAFLRDRIGKLMELREEEEADAEREREDQPYLSMQRLGVSPGRAA